MSTYVLSDIHGCFEEFKSMLYLIDFKTEDDLYILGDIMDRGPNAISILDYIVGHKNIHLLKGNHELFCEDYLESGSTHLWYRNGGQTTHTQIVEQTQFSESAILDYLKKLPIVKVVGKYILVHAGLYFPKNHNDLSLEELIAEQDEDFCLWDRSNLNNPKKYKDYTVICGHTPVQSILDTIDKDKIKIHHTPETIFIDCGCVFKRHNGRLGCLRLEDMEEFYI